MWFNYNTHLMALSWNYLSKKKGCMKNYLEQRIYWQKVKQGRSYQTKILIFRSVNYTFNVWEIAINPLTPMSDQDRISPFKINALPSKQVIRIRKNINKGITSWSNTKFSKLLTSTVWQTVRRITSEVLGVKGLISY